MVDAIPIKLKVTLKYASGSFTYSDIKMDADNEKIYELASAMNSIQTKPATKIFKTEISSLASY